MNYNETTKNIIPPVNGGDKTKKPIVQPKDKSANDANNKIKNINDLLSNGEMPMETRRDIDGYKEMFSIRLAGRIVILAENPKADEQYQVCNYRRENALIGEYYDIYRTCDYLAAVREYTSRIDGLLQQLESERDKYGCPNKVLGEQDCVPDGLNEDLTGKLIIIKAEILAPEYRSQEHQLQKVFGGFGANPNARGTAVYCKDLYTGKECRYERGDILGVAAVERLPKWARAKVAGQEIETPEKKPSLQEKLDRAKEKATEQNSERKNNSKTKKRGEQEVD